MLVSACVGLPQNGFWKHGAAADRSHGFHGVHCMVYPNTALFYIMFVHQSALKPSNCQIGRNSRNLFWNYFYPPATPLLLLLLQLLLKLLLMLLILQLMTYSPLLAPYPHSPPHPYPLPSEIPLCKMKSFGTGEPELAGVVPPKHYTWIQ